jgi:hypothetical protein
MAARFRAKIFPARGGRLSGISRPAALMVIGREGE